MKSAIATLTNAPYTIVPSPQEEQSGEHNEAEVVDTAEANPNTQEVLEWNGQEKPKQKRYYHHSENISFTGWKYSQNR